MLYMNLTMDIFAGPALATDYPSKDLMKRRPEIRQARIITTTMWKMIIGQALYQLTLIFTLHYAGQPFFTYDGGEPRDVQLKTLIFTSFIFMQLANQFKCVNILPNAIYSLD